VLICDGFRECFERLPDEVEVRREELAVLPMDERFARALEVFSRANAANDRRLRREIEPITEPVKLDVVVVVVFAAVVVLDAVPAGEVRGGRTKESGTSAGVEETGTEVVDVWEW
jgi:hypothetical protein